MSLLTLFTSCLWLFRAHVIVHIILVEEFCSISEAPIVQQANTTARKRTKFKLTVCSYLREWNFWTGVRRANDTQKWINIYTSQETEIQWVYGPGGILAYI